MKEIPGFQPVKESLMKHFSHLENVNNIYSSNSATGMTTSDNSHRGILELNKENRRIDSLEGISIWIPYRRTRSLTVCRIARELCIGTGEYFLVRDNVLTQLGRLKQISTTLCLRD